jgi:2-succinyl-6-hydroxy-2,4-cyclohexadiene-1-carboxylate synthase
MPHINVNGIDLYYELEGDEGEPLVLMHGYTGDITDWRHQLPEFSTTHRVLMIEHRGHGRSYAPKDRSTYTIEQMSLDAENLIGQVGFERYHLVGHSMGGAIAQEMALRSPTKLLSLTLHDTAHFFDLSGSNEIIRKWMETRNKVAEEQGMEALSALKLPFPRPPFMPAEREDETRERLAAMSVDAFLGAGSGLRSWPGSADRLATISVSTMVIYGDLDSPPLIESARHMAATIPGATLEVVPQAAHSPQYERPDLFNAALQKHLTRAAVAGEVAA